VTLTFRRRV